MQVSAIHTYPVKGCRRLDHDSAVVERWGLAGDRRWLVTDPAGVAITQRDVATLALLRAVPGTDGLMLSHPGRGSLLVPPLESDPKSIGDVWGARVAATPAGTAADDWLSEVLGCDARLVWMDDPTRRTLKSEQPGDSVSFADGYPVLLANEASLARLNDWIAETGIAEEGPLPMTRFRPNMVISGAEPFVEDEWTGGTVRIGQTAYRVAGPCARCVVTTTDQESGEKGKEPLRTLGRYRNVNQELLFGVNLIPVTAGRVTVGDQLIVNHIRISSRSSPGASRSVPGSLPTSL